VVSAGAFSISNRKKCVNDNFHNLGSAVIWPQLPLPFFANFAGLAFTIPFLYKLVKIVQYYNRNMLALN
jgi:hypothetical protein